LAAILEQFDTNELLLELPAANSENRADAIKVQTISEWLFVFIPVSLRWFVPVAQ